MVENSKNPKTWWQYLKSPLELLGILAALITGIVGVYDASQDRKLEAYRKLGDSYTKIMDMCMNERCLDCYDQRLKENCPSPQGADSLDRIHRQRVIYTIIINHFEQAFKMLEGDQDLWPGWIIYIDSYLQREAFRHTWYDGDETWSKRFQEFMKKRTEHLVEVDSIKVLTRGDSMYLKPD
jgi:hypothetical protein